MLRAGNSPNETCVFLSPLEQLKLQDYTYTVKDLERALNGQKKNDAKLFEYYRNGYVKELEKEFESNKLNFSKKEGLLYLQLKQNLTEFASAKHFKVLQNKNIALQEHLGRFQTEKTQTLTQATIANKFVGFTERGSNIKYQTANDDFVRPEHRKLNGIVRPASDPFWINHSPPLGWKCRCNLIETNSPVTDVDLPNNVYDSGYEGTSSFHSRQIFSSKHKTFDYQKPDWLVNELQQGFKDELINTTLGTVKASKQVQINSVQNSQNKVFTAMQCEHLKDILPDLEVTEINGQTAFIQRIGTAVYYFVLDSDLNLVQIQ